MSMGFKLGDLVKNIYSGKVGILLKLRPLDRLSDAVGNEYYTKLFDAYVLVDRSMPSWVPLEHIKKI